MSHPLGLDGDALRRRLALCGVVEEDARDCLAWIEAHPAGDPVWGLVGQAAVILRERIGRVDDRADPFTHLEPYPYAGVPLLLAHLVVAEEVVAEYRRRGVGADLAWHSLSDLGQQVSVSRHVSGEFGLHAAGWVGSNFAGGLLWLGRLQFTLQPSPWAHGKHVLGCHIPERGPLSPAAVDDSLAAAMPAARSAYPDMDIHAISCTSWLLDPGWREHLGPDSNIVAFADRFEVSDTSRDGRRDAIYFTWHRETQDDEPVDPDLLPQHSRLQRAVAERLRRGDRFLTPVGRLLTIPA